VFINKNQMKSFGREPEADRHFQRASDSRESDIKAKLETALNLKNTFAERSLAQ
jgi:hypothetical protein